MDLNLTLFLKVFFLRLLFVTAWSDLDTKEAQIVGRLLYMRRNGTLSKPNIKTFPCKVLPASITVPVSVHRLRPSDVKVVAAMGDSLTAGRGANGGIVGLLVDYRGLSWSGGGDGQYTDTGTFPNILREYNPNLYGFSTGIGDRDKATSRFNVAKTGDEALDVVEQATILVERMKSDSNIDFEKDWKVITVFIGANDLCAYCTDKEKFTPALYRQHLTAALDILHANIPRAFVNLVEVLNIEIAEDLAKGLLCKAIHIYACDCAANPKSADAEKYLLQLKEQYREIAEDLATSGRYDTRQDFTVVLQPFYKNTYLPRTSSGEINYTYFAEDCFHYSSKGQRAAGEALWNNMIEPVGKKRVEWTPEEAIECPTETNPYFFTNKNSHLHKHG